MISCPTYSRRELVPAHQAQLQYPANFNPMTTTTVTTTWVACIFSMVLVSCGYSCGCDWRPTGSDGDR